MRAAMIAGAGRHVRHHGRFYSAALGGAAAWLAGGALDPPLSIASALPAPAVNIAAGQVR